ncbi:MAG: transglutaminase-like domain-containing protein, partial [Bacteroidales bacterium]
MKRFIFPFFLLALLATSCFEKHFIHDKDERHQVHQDFLEREKMVGDRHTALFSVFDGDITKEEREALEFLYAYMPLSDLADYDGNFYLNQVRNSLEARNFFSWGNSVPEDVFRHFVLPYRVNNENLDSARTVFFHELKDRIKEMSMYDAALEVNHWCHEKVTYRPSDSRTSSPLSTVKNALGRCGEESTFTVTALRSVGIPARQCYTPRWAHTDDNHAWVEVWVNGKWYFLGACEPDPELNMGWFAIPSTRTMMVHSNAFGKYKGEEEVNYQTPLFSRVNMLPHYTDTEKIKITILDEANKPVPGAEVKFKLYNYAEYYPIASKKSDTAGIAQLTTGKGDLLIWASKGTKYGYKKIDVRAQDELTIILNKEEGKEYVELLEMCPPAELHNQQKVKQAEIERHHKRLQYEDSLRNAYMATFMTDKQADLIVNENLTKEQVRYFIKKSEGNYAEIKDFLMTNPDRKKGIYLYDFLNSLSEKDVRDVSAATLQSHITFFNPEEYPFEVYLKGIISPRISNEGLRMWRSFLKEKMNKELKSETSCQKLIDWITRNIVIDDEANYFNCPVSPQG